MGTPKLTFINYGFCSTGCFAQAAERKGKKRLKFFSIENIANVEGKG